MPEPVQINVVYAQLQPGSRRTHRRGDVTVYMTERPIRGCDAYAYWDAFSYSGLTEGPQYLIMVEPPVVLPGEYRESVWGRFDHVFALVDSVAGRGAGFSNIRYPAYDDSLAVPTEAERLRLYPVDSRQNAICMINGHKLSSVPGELYSKRVDVAQWFHDQSEMSFHVYGSPPFDLPNYQGPCSQEEKRGVLARYRYSLCYENCYHPVWSAGYLTEKLLHCFECRTVPIYLGCSNIERYVPEGSFVDARRFNSYAELDTYLRGLTDADYRGHVARIDEWVAEGKLSQFWLGTLYDNILSVYWEQQGLPPDELARLDGTWVATEADAQPDEAHTPPLWTWDYLASYPFEDTEPFGGQQGDPPRSTDTANKPAPSGGSARDAVVQRVLYVGPRYAGAQLRGGIDYGMWNFLRTFEAYEGVEVDHFDMHEEPVRHGAAGMAERLERSLAGNAWDLVFFAPSENEHDRAVMEALRAGGDACSLAWITDPTLVEDARSRVDWVLTPTSAGDSPSNVIPLRWACNTREYRPEADGRESCLHIVRSGIDEEGGDFVEAARSSGIPVSVIVADGPRGLPFAELQYAFSRAKVSFVCGALAGRFAVEAAARCGFVIAQPFDGLTDYFRDDPPGQRRFAELATAREPRELVEKASHALAHDREREVIAERAYQRVQREHTWFRRLEDVGERIGLRFPTPPEDPVHSSPFTAIYSR
jgi:hypothetical protein